MAMRSGATADGATHIHIAAGIANMVSSVSNSTFSPSKPAGSPAQRAAGKADAVAATTLWSALTRLLTISKLFCAVPPLHRQSRVPSSRRRFGLYAAYQFVFFATITVCMVFHHLHFDGTLHRIERFLYTISYFINAGNTAIILTGTPAMRQFYGAYHAELLAIDQRLLGVDQSYAAAAGYARLQRFVAGWLGVVAAIFGASMAIDMGYNSFRVVTVLRSWIVYLVTNVTVCLIVLQFVAVLRSLSDKYATINGMLERMFLLGNDGGGEAAMVVTTIDVATVEPHHLKVGFLEFRELRKISF